MMIRNDVSKIYSDNIDYNKFINLKDKEIDNEEKNEYFPEFLNNSVKIKQLCSTHMIDLNYFSRESGTEDQLMYKTQSKYIKPKMIECLKRNLQLINQILSENINAMINDEFKQIRTFFKFEYTNDYFDFLNFKQKEYFLVLNEENNKKTDNQLYVLNSEKEFINHNISNKEYIGCQIFESGKLFAGKFNNDGKLNGKGIFINKKGNLIHGSFYF